MITELPLPTKRPFGHPLPEDVIDHFRHPDDANPWHHAYTDGDHTWLGNGHILLRVDSPLPEDRKRPLTRPDTFRETIDGMHWSSLESVLDLTDGWQPLEKVSGLLFRFPPKPIWERTVTQVHPRGKPSIRVRTTVCQLASLQLVARLPRAEVYAGPQSSPVVHFRFRGGVGLIAPFPGLSTDISFAIFGPNLANRF